MRPGLAVKILVPFAVFMAALAVLGDLFMVALVERVAQIPGASLQAIAAARTLALTYVLVSLLLVLLLLGIYMIIVRGLTRRVRVLQGLTREVATGTFPAMVQAEGHDELTDLTRAFVDMNTRLERAARRLEEARGLAARNEKLASLGKLASSVAHEINNPNGIISLYAQIALRRGDLAPELAGQLTTIRTESGRIERIVRELLDYARPTVLRHGDVALAALLHETVAQLAPLLAGVAVRAETGGRELRVTGDADRLRQVFVNLLTNARDAAGEGGEITVTGTEHDGLVRVQVSDSGPGVPPDLRERVFEPFFTTKEKGRGSGLGLAVCHRIIVEEHGGIIELTAGGRAGATFTVTLPAAGAGPEVNFGRRRTDRADAELPAAGGSGGSDSLADGGGRA